MLSRSIPSRGTRAASSLFAPIRRRTARPRPAREARSARRGIGQSDYGSIGTLRLSPSVPRAPVFIRRDQVTSDGKEREEPPAPLPPPPPRPPSRYAHSCTRSEEDRESIPDSFPRRVHRREGGGGRGERLKFGIEFPRTLIARCAQKQSELWGERESWQIGWKQAHICEFDAPALLENTETRF